MRLEGTSKDPLAKTHAVSSRAITNWMWCASLLAHAATNGVGQTYLIQHSAGSGKSNSITWAAYQLIEVYPP